jgi:hypothetical protein
VNEIRRRIKRSQAQEKRTAEQYRGSRQARSGAGWAAKNDVRSETVLIENKRTDNKSSITIKNADLIALRNRAAKEMRIPILQFDLGGHSYSILTDDDARELLGL